MTQLEELRVVLRGIGKLAVAVSGGIDSLTLASVAHRTLGPGQVSMHHATSPAVPPEATSRTRFLADAEGWSLDMFDAGEFSDPAYRANPANRCFYCKFNLYGAIAGRSSAPIASGTNLDDLADWRPGLQAARTHGVRHPLVEAGIDKTRVRAIARLVGLEALAELPASPCLSSRVETGLRIDPAQLAAVHAAERLVGERTRPATVRCRLRAMAVVIELDAESLSALAPPTRAGLAAEIACIMAEAGIVRPVDFAAYRTGSAFLRPHAA